MKDSELYNEIAIIFRRTTVNGLYDQILYKPIKCVYCEKVSDELAIVDSNNTYYNHLICGKLGDAYGLRTSVKDIMNIYNLSNPDDAKKEYFNYINDLLFKILYTEKEGLFLYGFNNKDEIITGDQDFEGIKLSIPNTDIEEKQEEQKDSNITDLSLKLKEKVIGQDSAIDKLITTIWTNDKLKDIDALETNKLNILLIGNSGVGKTLMIKTLGKLLNKDVYFTSANNLSQTGYVGNSVTDILSGLIAKCQGDINRINNSIVFIDEIDKISANKGGQISTESVQQELLTMLEGGEYYIKSENSDSQVNISTKNIMFICAGAFDGIRKKENKSLGFNNDISNKITSKITPNDIENYGFIPELVGRLPIIIELNNLNKKDIINILKNKYGILESMINIVEKSGIELIVNENIYEEIAQRVVEYNMGAREIKSIVFHTLSSILNNISSGNISSGKIIISKETVINPDNYEYIKSEKNIKKKVRSSNENG